MPGDITLNSKEYKLVPFTQEDMTYLVRRYSIEQEAAAFSLAGEQSQNRITTYTAVNYPPPIYGFGRNRIGRTKGGVIDKRDFLRFWDAQDVMTHYQTQTTLGLNEQASTLSTANSSTLEVVRASAEFKGELYTLWEASLDGTAAGLNAIATSKWTGADTTWNEGDRITGGNVSNDEHRLALDLMPYKTHLLAVWASNGTGGGSNDAEVYRSSDGLSWAAASTQTSGFTMTTEPTANQDMDLGKLAEVAGVAVLAAYDETLSTVTFNSSTDAGDNWTDRGVDIPTMDGVKGVAVMRDPAGVERLYVGLAEGVWEVNTSAWTAQKVMTLPLHEDNCRGMIYHQGSLWVPIANGESAPFDMAKITSTASGYVIEVTESVDGTFLSLMAGDGCPTDYLGPIRTMVSSGSMLFAAGGGGAANRNAWILVHNGLGWHPFFRNGTANQKIQWMHISAEDDGTERLHFSERTGTSTVTVSFLELPLSNPKDGQTYNYQLNGYIDRPEYNLDMPNVDKSIRSVYVDAADLGTTSAEYENIDYGTDGAAASTSDLGNIVDGTQTLEFASGAGLSAKSIAIRQNLIRDAGSTAHSPKDRGLQVNVKAKPSTLEGFEFVIDIPGTAEATGLDNRTVISNLETARDSVIQVAFQYGGFSAVYVDIRPPIQFLEYPLGESTAADATTPMVSRALVRVEQVGS